MQLNDMDYKLLKFIGKSDKVSLVKILEKFPENKYSTAKRLLDLKNITFETMVNGRFTFPTTEKSYITEDFEIVDVDEYGFEKKQSSGMYSITGLGRKALQDYELTSSKLRRRDIILFVIPIMISGLALLKSYEHEVSWLLQQLLQLLK